MAILASIFCRTSGGGSGGSAGGGGSGGSAGSGTSGTYVSITSPGSSYTTYPTINFGGVGGAGSATISSVGGGGGGVGGTYSPAAFHAAWDFIVKQDADNRRLFTVNLQKIAIMDLINWLVQNNIELHNSKYESGYSQDGLLAVEFKTDSDAMRFKLAWYEE